MLNDKMECESRRASALVLVVDDDPVMRLLIGELLQQTGFAVEEAEDGLSALTAFEHLQPDIVLLDVNMPGMDGFTVCTELRRMPVGNGIPVLMVTGLDDEASINRAYEVGATDFITKPINWPVLGHRVRYILRASRAFDDLRGTEAKIRQRTAELQKVTELLSTKSRVQSVLLTSTDNAMFADVLDVVLDDFQSRCGFFGYIDEAGSLVCPSTVRNIWERCEVADKSTILPREKWSGLWGRILLEKKALYKNESHSVPKRHLPLSRSLGSPIVYQGEVIGSIHVANREGDYGEEDRELMESICSIIAPVLNARLQRDREERERKRAEKLLAAQHAVTRVLAEAPTFADAGPRILQAIGESSGWDLGGLWRVDRQANLLRCVELWHAPSIEEAREFEAMARSLTFSPGVGLVGHVWSSGKPAWISDVVEDINLPHVLAAAGAGLHSAFALPILFGDEVLGVIDFFSREILKLDSDMLQMFAAVGSQIGQFTERKRAEEALRESEEQFRQLAENIPEVFWITNVDQDQFIYISPAYEKIWGHTLESLAANPGGWMESIHPDDYKRVFAALKKAPLGEYLEEYRIVRPDGTLRWVRDHAFPVANEQGQVYRITGIVEDITDRKEAEQRLLHLAHYDSLTNLPNRTLFRDRLTQTIARANRNKQIVALLFIDLDRFKEINDTLGHDTGDCLLTGVATRLKNTLRQADNLARLGGDEFTLIVEDLYHETEYENIVITIAQKILESFSSPFSVGGRELFVTPSIGITLYPFDADDVVAPQLTVVSNERD
jgi:diguanylate cyclase (GGDEF)-like protein/PAS domain S-box-containing protein